MGALALILGAALLVGCADLLGPGEMPGDVRVLTAPGGDSTVQLIGVRFAPPPEYARWYHEAEVCAGKHGRFGAIKWYMVPMPWRGGRGTMLGYQTDGTIVVNALMAADSGLIMHESLHDILIRNGWHPIEVRGPITADSLRILTHPAPPFGVCAPY